MKQLWKIASWVFCGLWCILVMPAALAILAQDYCWKRYTED